MAESGPKTCSLCGEISAGSAACPRCGSALPTGAALPQAGSSPGLPHTEIRHGAASYEPAPVELPKAGRSDQSFAAPPTKATKRAAPKTVKRARVPLMIWPTGLGYIVKSGVSIAFLLILTAAAGLIFLSRYEAQGPRASIPRIAQRYLSSLAITDYASAYYLLSEAAQARCSMDDFRRLRGAGEWTISNVKLVEFEPEAGVVSYLWSAAGQPPTTAYLFFVHEKDRWVVPYNFNVLKEVEEAVRTNNPDMALLDSQEAVELNPRDPMARAYLCEAAYFRKFYDQAHAQCQTAVDLSAKYPSNLSAQSLAHIKLILSLLEHGR